ncbi:MAG: aminopeptidase P family protein [Bacteroidales bacterium]|nr:aminopeptidase P family protein [Bacteroidales bacterium]
MFNKTIYTNRRNRLREKVQSGLILILGNPPSPQNTFANHLHFRQDSSFLYFFGLNFENLAGVLDIDNNKDYLFGDDIDIDDIIWMGPQKSIKERANEIGVENSEPFSKLFDFLNIAIKKGRKIHFLPQYRAGNVILLEHLLGIHPSQAANYVSAELIKAVVSLRSIKEACEIEDMEKFEDVAYEMHVTAMKMAKPGVVEQEIAGAIEGVGYAHGGLMSFPPIVSVNGQTLHNPYHENVLEVGRMLLCDAGAESPMRYATDITRTTPVGGKFNQRQKEIYEIVFAANMKVIDIAKPGIFYRDVHLEAMKVLANGLSQLGIMKGDVDEAVAQGAHAIFCPHGLGHMMGLDCHDMESLGEDYVGYDDEIKRSTQFGLSGLRLGRRLQTGFMMSDEPGIYFIPELIDKWKSENKFTQFINYEKLETYKDFGGIRLEDDLLVTEDACRVLGKPIPKTVDEVENMARQ